MYTGFYKIIFTISSLPYIATAFIIIFCDENFEV